MDAEQLRENAHKMVDFIADYYKTIEDFPVLSQVQVHHIFHHLSLYIYMKTQSFYCKSLKSSILYKLFSDAHILAHIMNGGWNFSLV